MIEVSSLSLKMQIRSDVFWTDAVEFCFFCDRFKSRCFSPTSRCRRRLSHPALSGLDLILNTSWPAADRTVPSGFTWRLAMPMQILLLGGGAGRCWWRCCCRVAVAVAVAVAEAAPPPATLTSVWTRSCLSHRPFPHSQLSQAFTVAPPERPTPHWPH